MISSKIFLLFSGLTKDDETAVSNSVKELEVSLCDEPKAFIQLIKDDLCFYVASIADYQPKIFIDYFKRIMGHCDRSTPTIRKILLEILIPHRPGLSFYRNYYLSKPWELDRLTPLAKAIANRVKIVPSSLPSEGR